MPPPPPDPDAIPDPGVISIPAAESAAGDAVLDCRLLAEWQKSFSDPECLELFRAFGLEARRMVGAIGQCLNSDPAEARRVLHALGGMAGNFGARRLARAATDMGLALKAGEPAGLAELEAALSETWLALKAAGIEMAPQPSPQPSPN
jgi:HPt (histidine-containing phosphotransfer) domain-containing protein